MLLLYKAGWQPTMKNRQRKMKRKGTIAATIQKEMSRNKHWKKQLHQLSKAKAYRI